MKETVEGGVITKRRIVNMNYPPKDMPKEVLERFWYDPDTKEESERWAERMRRIKPKKGSKIEPSL